jgi:3-hydroxyisobutyrate dehydrogenase-like beta-hydroxyacid dehydrogenase
MVKGEDKSRSTFGLGESGLRHRTARAGPSSGTQVAGNPITGNVGFVGLGRMGTEMAGNLAAAGRQIIAYVRRAERIGELAALGLRPTTEIADLFDCSIVISMLPDDRTVREIVFGREDFRVDGLAAGLAPGAIHLSMSTISTATASELAGKHARCGQGYVAAPVFGNPDAARTRQLFVIAAGATADIERCRPILDALGQQTFLVGTSPETANLVKLAGNVMAGATLQIMGEVLALARKRGLDPRQLLAVLTGSMFGSRVHKLYGDRSRNGITHPAASSFHSPSRTCAWRSPKQRRPPCPCRR